MSSILREIQLELQSIYALHMNEHVDDFVVGADILEALELDATRPQVVLHALQDDLLVGVYPGLSDDQLKLPWRHPVEERMPEFCQAIEEVSHFLYIVWNARRDKSVSWLGVEVQAEIDKFILCRKHTDQSDAEIFETLFINCDYYEHLNPEEFNRYREANELAMHFCKKLLAMPHNRLSSTLRDFYRLRGSKRFERLKR